MLALVTGSSGFIGSHLVERLLARGDTVRCLSRASSPPPNPLVERAIACDYDRVDLGVDTALLRDVDVVYHLGGVTRAPHDLGFTRGNTFATRNLLHALALAGASPRRFVYMSSTAAGGPARSLNEPADESSHAPIEPYGRSKLEAERIVASAGRPFAIVRPAAVYGPRDRDFLAVFTMIRKGLTFYPGNRDAWTSLVHVDDVVRATIAAADSPAGGSFCVADDAPLRWRDVYELAYRATDTRTFEINVPRLVVSVVAALGDVVATVAGRAPLLNSQKATLAAQRFWVCSNRRARETLGWEPLVDPAAGFRATYDWYRRERWL